MGAHGFKCLRRHPGYIPREGASWRLFFSLLLHHIEDTSRARVRVGSLVWLAGRRGDFDTSRARVRVGRTYRRRSCRTDSGYIPREGASWEVAISALFSLRLTIHPARGCELGVTRITRPSRNNWIHPARGCELGAMCPSAMWVLWRYIPREGASWECTSNCPRIRSFWIHPARGCELGEMILLAVALSIVVDTSRARVRVGSIQLNHRNTSPARYIPREGASWEASALSEHPRHTRYIRARCELGACQMDIYGGEGGDTSRARVRVGRGNPK